MDPGSLETRVRMVESGFGAMSDAEKILRKKVKTDKETNLAAYERKILARGKYGLTMVLNMVTTANHLMVLNLDQWNTFMTKSSSWFGNFTMHDGYKFDSFAELT